jgi:IPT/TIG domain-containing protein
MAKAKAVEAQALTSEEIGNQCAGAARKFDKPNTSSRMMLLDPSFWTEIVKAFRGEGEPLVPEPVGDQTFTSMNPDTLAMSDADTEVSFIGSGFTEGSKIIWNGSEEPTNFVSDTELTTIVRPSTVSFPLAVPVAIRTGDFLTPPLNFTFTEAV